MPFLGVSSLDLGRPRIREAAILLREALGQMSEDDTMIEADAALGGLAATPVVVG